MALSQSNVAIIGGGIMGLCAAHALHTRGCHISLFDPVGFPAHNASQMAGGMLAPYSEIEHMPLQWIEAALRSIALWHDMPAPTGFAQRGSLLIAHEEDRYMLERFAAHLPDNGRGYRVNHMRIAELEPRLAPRFTGGLFLEDEAHLHPAMTMQSLCEFLQENGVKMRAEQADPHVLSAQYDVVIDCRGYEAHEDDGNLRGVKGEILIVRNPEFSLSRPVRLMHPRYPLYIVPRPDHVFMIGATVIESADNGHVSLRSGLELMSALYSLHPSFGEADILEMSTGIRPAYADNLPRIKANGNIVRCNGLFRHGFLLAPIMAECTAHMIAGQPHDYMTLFTGENHEDHTQRPAGNAHRAA